MARREQELIAHCPSCRYMETIPIVDGSLDSWLVRADGAKVYGNYYQPARRTSSLAGEKDGQIFHKCNNPVRLIRFYHNALGMVPVMSPELKITSTTKPLNEGLPMEGYYYEGLCGLALSVVRCT